MMQRRIFLTFILCIFLVLLAKLFLLQIIQGDFYYRKSENNRIQLIESIAPRGRIYDCKGELLVDNRPSFCASLIPWLAADRVDETLERFKGVCKVDEEEIKKKIKRQRFRPFQPILLAQDLTPAIVSKILESENEFPGIVIRTIPSRYYPNHSLCAHLLGYVQEINEKDLERLKDEGYEQSDLIGQNGIERSYETFLRGVDGGTGIEIDVRGRPAQVPCILGEKEPTIGADAVLTIEKRVQEACESALQGNRGAIVVMNPFNGDIIGMASSPGFDPNMFIQPISSSRWQKMVNNPSHPMLNRVVQATYPPASVFKIVVAVAALEEGKADLNDVVKCEGAMKAGKRTYRCWNRSGHGLVNFARGVAESCDIYFYHLGVKLGPEIIEKYARLFGLGVPSGIEIGGEKSGIVPGPEWKKRTKGERWFLGDTFNFSIGQGHLLTTPLQMANVMNVLFNGGKLYRPRLVREILFRGGEKKKFSPQLIKQIVLKPSTVNTMRTVLRLVVTRGTGTLSNISEAEVIGKTGTAQNPGGKDHAWFIAFCEPQLDSQSKSVTIAVLLENGGSGGAVACPIAARVLRSIYQIKPSSTVSGNMQTISDTAFIGD